MKHTRPQRCLDIDAIQVKLRQDKVIRRQEDHIQSCTVTRQTVHRRDRREADNCGIMKCIRSYDSLLTRYAIALNETLQ